MRGSNYSDHEKDLLEEIYNFRNHIEGICKKLETTELTQDDGEIERLNFDIKKLDYINRMSLNPTFQQEVIDILHKLEDNVRVAVLKGREIHRKNEKLRLKEAYGFIGEIIYFVKDKISRI